MYLDGVEPNQFRNNDSLLNPLPKLRECLRLLL